VKVSSWRSSGKSQNKSAKTPKVRKRKARQLKQMMIKLKGESDITGSPFCSLV
jgi:hypothetical protein